MSTEQKHAESGCTDYLQHPWQSCPENKPQPQQHSPTCKGTPHYYDGALGYEAMKCDLCGYELDLNAEANAKATAKRLAQLEAWHYDGWPISNAIQPNEDWHCGNVRQDQDVVAVAYGETAEAMDANAKLIVRAVNHADKLAEALREQLDAHPNDAIARGKSRAALAAYESEAQS